MRPLRAGKRMTRLHNLRSWILEARRCLSSPRWSIQGVMMERNIAVVLWTCLLGVGLTLARPPFTSAAASSHTYSWPPQLIGCVFLHRANATCRWTPGHPPARRYTLKLEKIPTFRSIKHTQFYCTTSNTSCTAVINSSSVRFRFCVSVMAHQASGDQTSPRRCESAIIETILPPVALNGTWPHMKNATCVKMSWSYLDEFPLSVPEIKGGNLSSQVEITARGQSDVEVRNETVRGFTLQVCHLKPDTLYTFRLRHRVNSSRAPWSRWSNGWQGRTRESAPSAAPAFWRRVSPADEDGRRLVTLLWKPLPHFLANGRVLFFNVTCLMDGSRELGDHGSCGVLRGANTSCSLPLPPARCLCSLMASTSAGTSPGAQIWLRGATDTEPPPPREVTAVPLDDNSLEVRWTAPANRLVSGFVVEWFAARESTDVVLHWQQLNNSCRSLVITEGVEPMERYIVSVRALYGERGAGQNGTVTVYTRQGVPSAGPKVLVQHISSSAVELTWSPVPVEQRHGFIRNYIIVHWKTNQTPQKVSVPAHPHRYLLQDLPLGVTNILMRAVTDAGVGPDGPRCNVNIAEAVPVLKATLLTLLLTSLLLMACLLHIAIVKKKLWQDVPDPSNSSLTRWTSKILLEPQSVKRPAVVVNSEIQCDKLVLLGQSQLQSPDADEHLSGQSLYDIQTHTCDCYSPFILSPAQPPQDAVNSERTSIQRSSARDTTSPDGDLSSCPTIYAGLLTCSLTLPPPPCHLRSNWQPSTLCVHCIKRPPGGDGKPCAYGSSAASSETPLSQVNGVMTFADLLRQHQSTLAFSQSAALLPCPAEVTSSHRPFSQKLCNSYPSLQPSSLPPPAAFAASPSPYPHSLFVDFSYCPL